MDRVVNWMWYVLLLTMFGLIIYETIRPTQKPPWEPEKDVQYQYLLKIGGDSKHWEKRSLSNHGYRMTVTRRIE